MYYIVKYKKSASYHFYILYKVTATHVTRTTYFLTISPTLTAPMTTTEHSPDIEPEYFTILAKFETKPTYDMIQEQYPELLL